LEGLVEDRPREAIQMLFRPPVGGDAQLGRISTGVQDLRHRATKGRGLEARNEFAPGAVLVESVVDPELLGVGGQLGGEWRREAIPVPVEPFHQGSHRQAVGVDLVPVDVPAGESGPGQVPGQDPLAGRQALPAVGMEAHHSSPVDLLQEDLVPCGSRGGRLALGAHPGRRRRRRGPAVAGAAQTAQAQHGNERHDRSGEKGGRS
jgi:hypothetical protein